MITSSPRLLLSPVTLGLTVLSLIALLLALASLGNDIAVDTPLLHYWAWLVAEQGRVPYLESHEISMPMPLLIHMAIGGLIGYDDLHVRIGDLLLLSLFLWLTWYWMRPFGRYSAWGACTLFALAYLGQGAAMTLQRDYLGLIPIAGALALATAAQTGKGQQQSAQKTRNLLLGIGALFSLSAMVKPHSLLALLPVAWYLHRYQQLDNRRHIVWLVAGLTLPGLAVLVWLTASGGLYAFFEMALTYLPLHNDLNGDIEVLRGAEHWNYMWVNAIHLGGYARWLGPALFGLYFYLSVQGPNLQERDRTYLLAGLLLAFALYPVIAGKFWRYHYLPLLYCLVLSTSLLLAAPAKQAGASMLRWLPRLAFFLALIVGMRHLYLLPGVALSQLTGKVPSETAMNGRVAALAEFLEREVPATATVQNLDWGGGTQHALLRARRPVPTRFMYDYHFYHHVDSATTQRLRNTFMQELRATPPDFIVRNTQNQNIRPRGPGTSDRFPELDDWLAENYRELKRLRGYQVLEHRRPTPSDNTGT